MTAQGGKLAEKKILNWLKNQRKDLYISRFVDTYDANRDRWLVANQKKVIIPRRPSDAIVVEKGVTYFLEVKTSDNKSGVTSTLFREQVAERTRIEAAGGLYVYLIYSTLRETWYKVSSSTLQIFNYNCSWDNLEQYKCNYPKVRDL